MGQVLHGCATTTEAIRMTFPKVFVLSSCMVAPSSGLAVSCKNQPNQIRGHQPRLKCAKDLLRNLEMAFSKFKAHLKREAARTVGELWDAIARAADIFTPAECENYFAAAGYDCE